MNNFSKVIRPAQLKDVAHTRPYDGNIFIKINFINGRLSISGVIGPRSSGNAAGGCGQIDMGFKHRNSKHDDHRYSTPTTPDDLIFAEGWNADKWYTLLEYWKLYHLNEWKNIEAPLQVLGWLNALPDTDKQPAWV